MCHFDQVFRPYVKVCEKPKQSVYVNRFIIER